MLSRQRLYPGVCRRRSLQRGMMVTGTLLILLSLMSIVLLGLLSTSSTSSSGLASNAGNGLLAVANINHKIVALNLADAGAEYAILWLSAQSAPPGNTAAFAPSAASFTLPLWNATTQSGSPPRSVVNYPDSNHTFSVTLYPSSNNSGSSQKSFLIESIGNDSGFKQILHVYVTQISFGHYAWFEGNGAAGTWYNNVQSFDGPVHYNTMAGGFYINWNDGATPIFTYNGSDAFTTGFSIGWKHNGTIVTGPPASSDTEGWNAISTAGPSSIKPNQNQITLPSTAADQAKQKTAALGTLSTAPTSSIGATLCPSGGIYIHGDIQQMTLSVSPSNSATQIIELYQIDPSTGAKVYAKITLNATTNQTSIQTGTFTASGTINLNPSATWPAAVFGLTNGVIYCDGNIGTTTQYAEGGLKGVIADNAFSGSVETHANALTIATDPTKNIQIDGSLLLNTPRTIQQNSSGLYEFHNSSGAIVTSASTTPPSGCVPMYVPEASETGPFLTKAGMLGLVSYNTVYGAYTMNSTGLITTGYLTSLEMDAAQFEFGSHGGTPYYGSVPSLALYSMGSNVHNGATFNWTRPSYTGYGIDNRFANSVPPYFPTTYNRYTLVSWQRDTICIQGTP